MRFKKIEGAEKLRQFIKPMLATLTDQPAFDDPDWIFEIKWDGYRAIGELIDGKIRLYSRNGLSFATAYRPVTEALSRIDRNMIIDGEIVVFDNNDRPSFQLLQNFATGGLRAGKIQYMVFDCLMLDGTDLTSLPLFERKRLLKEALPEGNVIRYCDHIVGEGKLLYEQIVNNSLEGMIAKTASGKYHYGKRSTEWLKIKNIQSEEAVIIGFTEPKGSRVGFGSLLLGQYENGKLKYIGNVGTGFNTSLLKELHQKLASIKRVATPLDVPVKPPPHSTWVDPVYVCNFNFTEKTSEGMVRHPVFLGLRLDKSPKEVSPEKKTSRKKSAA